MWMKNPIAWICLALLSYCSYVYVNDESRAGRPGYAKYLKENDERCRREAERNYLRALKEGTENPQERLLLGYASVEDFANARKLQWYVTCKEVF